MSNVCDVAGLKSVLGLPKVWVQREVKAGRLPVVKVGKATRFDVVAVAEELVRRAREASAVEEQVVAE